MILDDIAAKTRERVAEAKNSVPLCELRAKAETLPKNTGSSFEKALRGKDIAFICEVKKTSPSKGVIAEDFPYLRIAEEYERAGAAAISCLTEPYWFLGSDRYLREIAARVKIPVLRKDFTVDEYMIYEAKILGAAAVLLICSILSEEQLAEYLELSRYLGLSALVEAHDEALDADFLLLDSGTGSGKTFDHSLIDRKRITKPFLLAGGLTPDNLTEAAKMIHPYGVDLSSGIETDKVKDREKILAAVRAIRNI